MLQIEKLGLEKQYLVGQGYDGAAAMSGQFKGVQKYITGEVPYALYVHCAAHSLNLAISSSCQVVSIRNCIGTVSSVATSFRASSQRLCILIENIKKYIPDSRQLTLIKLCETRWIERHESITRFKELYLAIYHALKQLESSSNIETSKTAFQLSSAISASNFLISLHVIENIFALTLPLCIALQKVNIDLSYCYERIEDVRNILIEKRKKSDENFKIIFSECEKAMCEDKIMVPRTVGKQTSRDNMPANSPEQYYKRTIFLPLLDHFINQLDERFSKHHRRMSTLQLLIPKYCVNKIQECAIFYKPLLENVDTFDAEIKIWQTQWKNVSVDNRPKCLLTTLCQISSDFYPNIKCLLTILATLPVTTVTAERSFSTLRRLKTYLRNNIGQDRSTGLALMNIYRNYDIDVVEVINRFARLPRKMDFVL